MSTIEYSGRVSGVDENRYAAEANGNDRPYHRLGTVRKLQGLSRRTVARRLQIDVSDVRKQEDEYADLPLSAFYRWQQALDVPVAELFLESEDALSKPLLRRAQLVRLMKTALALIEQADSDGTRTLAQQIIDVLVKVMPELDGISAWHAVGKRRRLDELGVAATRTMSEEVFLETEE